MDREIGGRRRGCGQSGAVQTAGSAHARHAQATHDCTPGSGSALARQLGAGVAEDGAALVARLGREAHDHLAGTAAGGVSRATVAAANQARMATGMPTHEVAKGLHVEVAAQAGTHQLLCVPEVPLVGLATRREHEEQCPYDGFGEPAAVYIRLEPCQHLRQILAMLGTSTPGLFSIWSVNLWVIPQNQPKGLIFTARPRAFLLSRHLRCEPLRL